MRLVLVALLALVQLIGCSATRFADRPVVWRVDDARAIAEPAEREFLVKRYMAEVFLTDSLPRLFELRDLEPARDTNAMDEVPDSTWFTNRIGVRHISPEEGARGADKTGPPRLPITVVGAKSGGTNPGFLARDTTGRTFVVKFDPKANPEIQTAADAVVSRIFWAAGYNVPSDHVFDFARADLIIQDGSVCEDGEKYRTLLRDTQIESILAQTPRQADGRYRAIASLFLSGVPKGGIALTGTRLDDPNDRVDHEHRRVLRGLRALAAWTGHSDIKEDNTLDMYVTEDGRKFIRHFLVDFGAALGGHAAEKGRMEDGFEHWIDWQLQLQATLAFGFWKRPWEDRKESRWLSVGPFESASFEPSRWREAYPYAPFAEADSADLYWGAKLVMRFDRPLLEAIVKTGQYSDPEAAEYVVQTLLDRRDKVGRTWLEAVSPLDNPRIEGRRLCVTDLGVRFGLATSGSVAVRDEFGGLLSETGVDRHGDLCLPLPSEVARDGYHVMRLQTRRGRHHRPQMEIHLRLDGTPRVVGLRRAP
ncbi:MAG: hypothetical protein ACI9WU_002931 [Myxococcota bacterium]|jgi:hypothetical protein